MLLTEKDALFQNLWVVFLTADDINSSTQEPAVYVLQFCTKPHQSHYRLQVSNRKEVNIPVWNASLAEPHATSAGVER